MAFDSAISESVTILVDCTKCGKEIALSIPRVMVEKAIEFPVEYVTLHGNPPHILFVSIDNQYQIQGTKLSESVNVERQSEVTPLNGMVLLKVPPRFKRTALAMMKLRQASAKNVGLLTGKPPHVESQYLGGLFRIGYLERAWAGRFYVYRIPETFS